MMFSMDEHGATKSYASFDRSEKQSTATLFMIW